MALKHDLVFTPKVCELMAKKVREHRNTMQNLINSDAYNALSPGQRMRLAEVLGFFHDFEITLVAETGIDLQS